jgi:hypothetical protein
VVLDRRYAPPIAKTEQCLATVMQLAGSARAVPVLSGPGSPSAFLERVVRLERKP